MATKPPSESTLPLEVVSQQSRAVGRPQESGLADMNMKELFEAAIKQGSAMEVIKELRQMEADMNQRHAKSFFDEAMSKFQSECPFIIKGKGVPDRSGSIAYKYAPIEKIEEVIRPIESKYGFSHSFDQDVKSEPGWVIANCTITHDRGHSVTKAVKLPLGTKTAIMSDTQQYASALTFANRRVLGNAYGLVFAGEDKDGGGKQKSSVTGRVVTPDLRDRFFAAMRDIEPKLHAYAIDAAWIMPDEALEKIADEHIPHTKGEFSALRAKVEAHK
jgi:hypothetical protein